MDDHQTPNDPTRHRTGRFNAASSRAQAGAGRFYTHLMAKPPLQRALLIAGSALALLMVLLVAYILILIPMTPGISTLKQARAAKATTLMSADGKLLATLDQGLQERVKLKDISPNVISALVATEDHRFYDHGGIDFRRSVSAILHTLKGDSQGGSTITQQLARNMFPEEIGRSRNLNRKLKEMITAIKIESTYSKPEILEAYLNTVPFLYNAFGIEMAARTYFDKSAAQLDMNEAAVLVGMLKGTNYYNPVSNPERSLERRNVVLGQMLKHGIIDEARFKALKKRPLRLHFARRAERSATDTHFTAYVRKWLIQWADENDYNLQLDGLVVQTTLDYGLQQAALKAVERQADALQKVADVEWGRADAPSGTTTGAFEGMHGSVAPFDYFWKSKPELVNAFVRDSAEYRKAVEEGENGAAALKRLRGDKDFMTELRRAKTRLEAGFVAIDPLTAEVRAWVGSRDFQKEQFDHVAQAERQPGSTFKPIVYGAALEHGLPPNKLYVDAVTGIKAGDGKIWRPTDMHGTTGAQMTMRDGLVFSKNTITAQVMQDVGLPSIVKLARDMGVRESKLQSVPSLALGTSPVTLLEMVNTYTTIANQGQYRKPVFVKRILDREGKVIAEFGGEAGERAMSAQSAVTLIDMMRGVINRGTGTAIRYKFGLNGDLAGKTGTTQKNADGWFIMMHPNLVAGAWVGFNDNRVSMRSSYWGQGGHNAILLVGDFFKTAVDSGKINMTALLAGGMPAPAVPEAPPSDVLEDMSGYEEEGEPLPNGPGGGDAEVQVIDEPGMNSDVEVMREHDRAVPEARRRPLPPPDMDMMNDQPRSPPPADFERVPQVEERPMAVPERRRAPPPELMPAPGQEDED